MPEIFEGCRRALFTVTQQEELILAREAERAESELSMQETEARLKKNAIKAKCLSVTITCLNKQLGETLKEISKDSDKMTLLREAASRRQ